MSEYVTLIGAEDVRAAASSMREAAARMNNAVSYMDGALERHRRWADEWLTRLERIMTAEKKERT